MYTRASIFIYIEVENSPVCIRARARIYTQHTFGREHIALAGSAILPQLSTFQFRVDRENMKVVNYGFCKLSMCQNEKFESLRRAALPGIYWM